MVHGEGPVTKESLLFYKNHAGDEAPAVRFNSLGEYSKWMDIQARIVKRLSTKDFGRLLECIEAMRGKEESKRLQGSLKWEVADMTKLEYGDGSVDVVIFDYNPDATYSWDFGDEGTSDEPFPTYTYGGNGPYTSTPCARN